MGDYRETILAFIKEKGPSLPSDIYKIVGTSQLFASAMLGELVDNGKLLVTNLKRSTSPYYYLSDQLAQLEGLAQYLGEKDRQTFELLKQKKVLKDTDQTPLVRVSLRTIKDYALPLTITFNNEQSLFWKYFLVEDTDAEHEIKKILGIGQPSPAPAPRSQPALEQKPLPEKPAPKTEAPQTVQKPLAAALAASQGSFAVVAQGELGIEVDSYFKKNGIDVISAQSRNKKHTEIDYLIKIPSAVGTLEYFCKAKSKAKVNDTDVAAALLAGKQKNLPVLFITTGDITKKTLGLLQTELKGVTVQKI